MTTIVYSKKHNQIALDSRACAGSHIVSNNFDKYCKHKDEYIFYAGTNADIEIFKKEYKGHRSKATEGLDLSVIIASAGTASLVVIKDDLYMVDELASDDGIGSGWTYALAALKCGKTPREAVKIASQMDVYTGGRIKVFDLDTMMFTSPS